MKGRVLLSQSEADTFELGRRLGVALTSGDFVGLSGQLGAGKTLFSRGVAHGLGVPLDQVCSPTYAIVQSYAGRLPLHHADFFRLSSEADLYATGFFDLLESEGACLVEWVEKVSSAIPVDALVIRFELTSAEARTLHVTASGPLSEALLQRWAAEELPARI